MFILRTVIFYFLEKICKAKIKTQQMTLVKTIYIKLSFSQFNGYEHYRKCIAYFN